MLEYSKPIKSRSEGVSGYQYFIDRNHPLASSVGRVYLHRHIASLKFGHWLIPSEHVHHIDRDKNNNCPENLIVLSSSDHARKHKPKLKSEKACLYCNTIFYPTGREELARYCSTRCCGMHRRKFDKSREELYRLVWSMPTTEVAKRLGISDVSVTKRCTKLDIKKPGRGYWRKVACGLLVNEAPPYTPVAQLDRA